MFKVIINYPALEDEYEIIRREHAALNGDKTADVNKVLTSKDIVKFQSIVRPGGCGGESNTVYC